MNTYEIDISLRLGRMKNSYSSDEVLTTKCTLQVPEVALASFDAEQLKQLFAQLAPAMAAILKAEAVSQRLAPDLTVVNQPISAPAGAGS